MWMRRRRGLARRKLEAFELLGAARVIAPDRLAAALPIGAASSESTSSRTQWLERLACGFRNNDRFMAAIYFHLGGLDLYPEAPHLPTQLPEAPRFRRESHQHAADVAAGLLGVLQLPSSLHRS
jgi:hypothetical protein